MSKTLSACGSLDRLRLQAAAPAKPVNPLFEKRPKTFGEEAACSSLGVLRWSQSAARRRHVHVPLGC